MDRNSEGGQIVVVPQQPVSVTPAQLSSLATVNDNTDSIALIGPRYSYHLLSERATGC